MNTHWNGGRGDKAGPPGARSKRERAVSTVSEQVEVELVSGRFAGLESLKFGHQNRKETVVWAR